MKTVGIIGGLGPESTVEYYRGIIDSYREQEKDGNYPSIIINSINLKYMGELLNNIFLPETREHLLAIVDRLKAREAIEGLILGGTELPLILRDTEHNGIPFFDTTKIHVGRIVAELLS